MRVVWPALGAVLLLCAAGEGRAEPPAPRAPTDAEIAAALPLFRNYLDNDNPNRTRYRLDLKTALEKMSASGVDFFVDVPKLAQILYRSRPFLPPYEKKNLPRDAKFHLDAVNRVTSVELRPSDEYPDGVRASFSLPTKYPADAKKLATVPTPYPTILALHELVDFQEGAKSKEFPGAEVIRRRYAKAGPFKAVAEEWLVFAPVASRANFTAKKITTAFGEFWKRYHVDFDRVVLDGTKDALPLAASMPVFFAGVVVRADTAEGKNVDIDPALVANFAHIPVYVVGSEDAAVVKSLRAGGAMPKVGPADGLIPWLKAIPPRTTPTDFKWTVNDPDVHILANWINLNRIADADASLVVKTVREENAVRIEAKGIENLSIFLNDRIVDLGKPVRITINGKDVQRPASDFQRKLDGTLDGDVISIRKSGYYGWLFPVLLNNVEVPKPEAPAPTSAEEKKPTDGGGAGGENPEPTSDVSPEEREADAQRYFAKAEEAEKEGNLPKALTLFQKAVGVGESTFRAKAEAKVKEIQAKLAESPKPGAATK
jgi:hypothetical protein